MRNFNRDDRRGGSRSFGGRSFGGRDSGRPTTMHKAVCSNCNQPCEVPFRPSGEKPVFCNNCFRDKRDNRDNRDSSRPSQLDEINAKLDRILAALKA